MLPRRTSRVGRRPLRWLAAVIALMVPAAAIAGMAPAQAAPAPVVVTMGVTGATSSNCGALSLGGSDVWVTPDGALDFTTTVAGVNLLGLKLGLINISSVANLGGKLTIDGPKTYRIDGSKTTRVTPLAAGDHPFTFAFDTVTLLTLVPMPLSSLLPSGPLQAGVTLTYRGTIHVTNDAARCGVSVQLPGPVVSVSVTGLPPIVVSVSPITVPTIGGGGGGSGQHPSTSPAPSGTAPPGAPSATTATNAPGGGQGGFPGAGPDAGGSQTGASPGGELAGATPAAATGAPGKHSGSGSQSDTPLLAQPPVLLAIIATVMLASVTAAYARQRLLGRIG